MATVGRFARGFLDLLGIQNFGEAPRAIVDQVVPTVDIGEQYQLDLLRPIAFAIADIQVGHNTDTTLTVPPGEVWCVKQAAAGAVTDAGEAIQFNIAVRIEANSYALNGLTTVGASTAGLQVSQYGNLWIPSGASIGLFCQSKTGTVNGTVTAMVTRLRG